MHRTEGAYNESNLFVDGPPGTTIEAAWLNAVQEEIANVIEATGAALLLENTDTRTQLRDAINSLVVAAGISDAAYDEATWNGVTGIGPSKNAARDEFEKRANKKGPDVETKTADYNVTTADFGKSIRMNSAADKAFTLCSVGANEDGARITFIKQGTGKVTINAADVDYIHDGSATGTIYSTSDYATITLEYVHGMIRWVIISAVGSWTTT
jgi:hypothetical protein